MKFKTVLLLAVLSLPVQAFSDFSDCAKFAGTYQSITDYNRSPYLEVSWDASHVIFSYLENLDGSSSVRDYKVAFIADGVEHDGDIDNTGKTYTASCSSDGISIVRVGLFITPYATQMTLSDGILTETNTMQGESPQTAQYKVLSP
jgi:hypothetical protein